MTNPDNIKALYKELQNTYELGSEDEFRQYLSDANNREALRKELSADYDVGDSASFSQYLGFVDNEPTPSAAPTQQQKPAQQQPKRMPAEVYSQAGDKRTYEPDSSEAHPLQRQQKPAKQQPSQQRPAQQKPATAAPAAMPTTTRGMIEAALGKPADKSITYKGITYEDTSKFVQGIPQQKDIAEMAESMVEDAKKKADEKKAKQERQDATRAQVDELSKSIDEQMQEVNQKATQAWRERDSQRGFWSTLGHSLANAENPSRTGDLAHMYDNYPEMNELTAAKRSLDNAKNMIAEADHNAAGGFEGSFVAGVGRGFGQKFSDVSTWDFGISDLMDATKFMKILDKADRGKELTKSEQALLDAKVIEIATSEYFGDEVGRGYKAGSVTAESIPFMIEMMVNPIAGAGQGAEKMLARYALKRFASKNLAKGASKTAAIRAAKQSMEKGGERYVAGRVVQGVGRAVGDVLGAGGMAATTGAARTAADAVDRMSGDVHFKVDDQGRSVYDYRDNQENWFDAWRKAFLSTTIENYSEMFGNYFSPLMNAVGKGTAGIATSKFGKSLRLDKVKDMVNNVSTNDWGRIVSDFEKRANWHGSIGEFAEEIVGGVLNAILVGDQTLDTDKQTGVFNLDNLIDTFLGVSIMGGAFSAVNTGGYALGRHRLNRADAEGRNAFGEDLWNTWQQDLSSEDDEVVKQALKTIAEDKYLREDQKKAAFKYASAASGFRTLLAQEEKRREDPETDPEEIAERVAFDNGYDADEEGQRDIMTEAEMGGEPTAERQAAVDGVRQRIEDDADMFITGVRDAKKPHLRKDGSEQLATLKEKDAYGNDKVAYIVDGNVVMTPDGSMVDPEASDRSIVIFDPATGEKKMIDPTSDMGILHANPIVTADEIELNLQNERQRYIQQRLDEVQGTVNVTPGQQIAMPDGTQATVIAADGENITIQTADGQQQTMPQAEVQRIADELKMADYMERHPEAQQDTEQPTEETSEQPTDNIVEGAPSEFAPNTRIMVRDDDGESKEAVVHGRVRYDQESRQFVPDENGQVIEYLMDGEMHHDQINALKNKVEGYVAAPAAETETAPEEVATTEQQEPPTEQTEEVPTTEEMQQPTEEPTASEQAAPAREPMPMHKVRKKVDGKMQEVEEEDYMATTPSRAYQYLYEEAVALGLKPETADNLVQAKIKAAQNDVEKAAKATGPIVSILQKQREVDYWNEVKRLRSQAMLDEVERTREQRAAEAKQAAERREQRRNTEIGEAGSTPAEKYNTSNKIVGNKVSRTIADKTKIKGHYVLVEADALTPSHDPFNGWKVSEGFPTTEDGKSVNDRVYEGDKEAQDFTESIALVYDGQAVSEIPVVSSEGIVYDGNGRTMAGQIAARNNTDAEYIEALMENAANFGFTEEQVQSMSHPRVVMQVDEDMPYNATTFARFNKDSKKKMNNVNKAVSIGKQMTDSARDAMLDILDRYGTIDTFFGSEVAAADVVNMLVDGGFITQQEVPAFKEKSSDGKMLLSADGRSFVTNTLLGTLFDEEAIRRLGDDKDLKNSLLRAVPKIAENRRLGDYALTDEINTTIELLYDARRNKMTFDQYKRQGNLVEGMVEDRYEPIVVILADELSSGVDNFRTFLTLWNETAANDAATGGETLFGKRTKEDLKKVVIEYYKSQRNNDGQHNDKPAAGTSERRPENEETGTGVGDIQEDARSVGAAATTEQPAAEQQVAEQSETSNPTEEQRVIGQAMVDQLENMGEDVVTDLSEMRRVHRQAEQDKSESGRLRHFRAADGKIYGFTYRGKIYLDPRRIDAEVPIHEYAHPWCEAFRMLNPDGWKEVVNMMQGDRETWELVKAMNPDLTDPNDIVEEMIARGSGKNGKARAEAEYRRMGKGSNFGNVWNNIAKAIQDFWKKIGDFLNIKYETPEQIYDQVVKDFANKVNPRKRIEDYLKERDAEYLQAVESGDEAKARELFDAALRENIGNGMTPYVAAGKYRGGMDRLARGVKSRDPKVIAEVADLLAPLIPENAVLVPAPSHSGTATDMLDVANAIAERTGAPVADVLRSEQRASQYDAKRQGQPISSSNMGIRMEGQLPEGRIPIVIDNVVDTGNTAEACIKALGKGVVVSLADAADRRKHVASLKSANVVARDKNGNVVPLSQRFTLGGSNYLAKQKGEQGKGVSEMQKALVNGLVNLIRSAKVDITTAKREGQRMLDKYRALARLMNVWHGSGADFDKFDRNKIGSGQGAQTFGNGHYVTQVKDIGKKYAQEIGDQTRPATFKGLSVQALGYKNQDFFNSVGATDADKVSALLSIVRSLNYGVGNPVRMIQAKRESLQSQIRSDSYVIKRKTQDLNKETDETKRKRIEDSIKYYENKIEKANDIIKFVDTLNPKDFDGWSKSEGHYLYEVEIPDDNGSNYLEWDKPIREDQLTDIDNNLALQGIRRQEVSSTLNGEQKTFIRFTNDNAIVELYDGMTGEELYRFISRLFAGNDKSASDFLHNAGFTGIKYPAEYLSGGRTDGAMNYVIFDDNDLKITDKIRFHKAADGDYVPEMKPTFYSNAMKAVEGIKQEKATAEQWMAMLQKNGGLKAGEDKWIGLSDWLNDHKGKSLTKQEVMDYIRKNQIEIEEVNYAENIDIEKETREYIKDTFADGKSIDELQQEVDENAESADRYDRLGDNPDQEDLDEYLMECMVNEYGDDFRRGYTISDGSIEYDTQALIDTSDINEYNREVAGNDNKAINETRKEYTTDFLNNKREIALTIQTIEPWNERDEVHFGDAGDGRAVAWIRFGETTDADGKRVLVIDEIQSKRHQEGREKGYVPKELTDLRKQKKATDKELLNLWNEFDEKYGEDKFSNVSKEDENRRKELYSRRDEISEKIQELEKEVRNNSNVPDAPFEKNWHEVAMKRMLRYAAENGYDKVAWTTGEQQAERYNIGNVINKIEKERKNTDETYIDLTVAQTGGTISLTVNNDGEITDVNRREYSGFIGKPLSDVIGKNLADEVLTSRRRSFDVEDMMVGGEGMKGFYDQILPRFMDKYGKKWNVKTTDINLPNIGDNGLVMHSIDVTPEMKQSVMEGQPMFFRTEDGEVWGYALNGKIYIDPSVATPETPIHEYTHLWTSALRKVNPAAWERLKDEMRRQEKLMDYVHSKYPELTNEDELLDEVFAHYSGKRGAERLEADMREAIAKEKDYTMKAQVAMVFHKLRDILQKFWSMARDLFAGKVEGVENMTAEDFADMAMGDLMNGFNPVEAEKNSSSKMDKEYADAVERGDMETAQRMVDEAAREAGYTIHAYHGTGRADRVGNVFRPERATSGPMAFFTDNKQIASNYSTGKQDTSIAYEDEFDSYQTQFRAKHKATGRDYAIYDMWGFLPRSVQNQIAERAGHIRSDWEGDGGIIYDPDTKDGNGAFQGQIADHRGNVLRALTYHWLESGQLYNNEADFLKVLEMAGVNDALQNLGFEMPRYMDPNYREEAVYDVYLKIENPFDATTMVDEEFIKGFEEYAAEHEDEYEDTFASYDMWDKHSINAEDFADAMRDDIKSGHTFAWTRIPDIASDYLKSLGYDGIKDTGGKYGGVEHTVWIPFKSEQIKRTDPVTYDDQGNVIPLSKRFDNESKDIRYQKGDEKENRPSERGRTRFQAASSSEGLNSEGRARLSRISRTQPNSSAKLQKNTQSSLNKLKKFINGGYKFNISNAESIDRLVSGLAPKIGLKKSKSTNSFYGEFEINGDFVSLRLSTHPASGQDVDNSGADMSYSFVIYKGGKHKKDGSAPWVEYTYNPKEHSADEIVRSITDAANDILHGRKENIPANLASRMEYNTSEIEKRNKEYADAVAAGDKQKVHDMLVEEAEIKGYTENSDYQGTSAFNGKAPSQNAYYPTKEERAEAWENDEYDGEQSLGDFMDSGIDLGNLDWLIHDPRGMYTESDAGKESIRNLRSVVDGKKRTIKMYRSVPADVKEGSFRNGDWVTPSRKYAEENAAIHGWDDFRIIEQEVSVDDIWWDNNDINEWGYDDGNGYAYKNTENNRKLMEPTYDENGKLIPLSERFNEAKDDIYFRSLDPESDNVVDNAEVGTRPLSDREKVAKLEAEPKIKVYRSMQLIDGKLYPPMSAKSDGQLREPSRLGVWEEADERPDMADDNGKFTLNKGNGKSLKAAYNPYIHTSRTMLNDQFSEAQTRPNLVVVEMEVPESELTSDYKAEKAKDSVGAKQWKAGVIQGQLSGTREVILSRWAKPVRIVPDSEVAASIAEQIKGQVAVMPSNVVTPSVRAELEKLGVQFVETDNTGRLVDGPNKGKTWSKVYGKNNANWAMSREGDGISNARTYGEALESARRAGYTKKQFDQMLKDQERRHRQRVADFIDKLNLTDRVTVVDSIDEVEGLTKEQREQRKDKKGWYDRRNGRIVVILDNHHSVDDILKTVLHEGVAHHGLRALFGKNFDNFIGNVYAAADYDVRKRINELAKQKNWDIRTATEEYLAGLAEDTEYDNIENSPYAGWWTKIKTLFFDMLHKLGIAGEKFREILSDNELRYLLWRSYKNLTEPGRFRSFVDEAEDVVMQDKLKVGDYEVIDYARPRGTTGKNLSAVREIRFEPEADGYVSGVGMDITMEDGHTYHAFVELGEEPDTKRGDISDWSSDDDGTLDWDGQNIFDLLGADVANEVMSNGSGTIRPSSGARVERKRPDDAENTPKDNAYWNWVESLEGDMYTIEEARDILGKAYLEYPHATGERKEQIQGAIEALRPWIELMEQDEDIQEKGAWWSDAAEQQSDAVILGHDGDTYKAVGKSADAVSKALGIPKAADGSVSFPADDIDKNLPKLVRSGLRVGIAERLPEGASEDDVMFRDGDDTPNMEQISESILKEASRNTADAEARDNAMRAIGDNLENLRKAMSLQREFDRNTVNRVTRLAKALIGSGYLDGLRSSEVKRLLSAVENSTGRENIKGGLQKVMDIMIDNQLRHAEDALHKLESIRGSRVDAKGVEVQGQLDVAGQRMVETFKKARNMNREDVETRLLEAEERMGSDDDIVANEALQEHAGLQMALDYIDNIRASEMAIEDLEHDKREEERKIYEYEEEPILDEDGNPELKKDGTPKTIKTRHVKTEYKNTKDNPISDDKKREKEQVKQTIQSIEDGIRKEKIDQLKAYVELISNLGGTMRESMEQAKEWREAQKERVAEIQHNANSDMEGRPSNEHNVKDTTFLKKVNNLAANTIFAPLSTFTEMLRLFGNKSAGGEGYLFNRFVRGFIDARQKEIRGVRSKYAILDAKAREVFGDGVEDWADVMKEAAKGPRMMVDFWDGGKMQPHELHQGNLMYIYMVDKMSDGRMKLRKMGITEADVDAITEALDPRLKELADWLQEEFLVDTRKEYNETHKRMFGASMAEVENYFPLKILANARVEKPEDLDAPERNEGISTRTGSIIKRTANTLALDLTGADALHVILDHVAQMEHWNAFAEYNRDLNTLRTYKRFRNQVQNMTTLYGNGKELWEKFNEVSQMVTGAYHPKQHKLDKGALEFAQGVTSAKVSFRINTALKQLLSLPAYLPYINAKGFFRSIANNLKNSETSFQWCMKHLPMFEERWKSRVSGDPRLAKTAMDWQSSRANFVQKVARVGMLPNAFVDALTVSIGAHAVYETRLNEYLKEGYKREDAEKKAIQDAEIAYNETQQSSEGGFLSTMQRDRTWLSVMFTVFRNASMAYQRQLIGALRNLGNNLTKEQREDTLAYETKQMVREGIPEEQAEAAAKNRLAREMRKNALAVATFGFIVQFAWNLGGKMWYLLFGDDDDEKSEMWKDIWAQSTFGGVEGFTGGDVMSEFGRQIVRGDYNPRSLDKDMPLSSDLASMMQKFGQGKAGEALNDMLNLIVQAGIGVNPQSLTDIVLATMDMCGNDVELSREALIFATRVLQVPQSQIKKMYFDEIGMNGEDAQKMSVEELVERYARYQVKRGRMITPWQWDDEELLKKEEEKGMNAVRERMKNMDTEELINMRYTGDKMKSEVQKEIKRRMDENPLGSDEVNEAYQRYEDKYKELAEYNKKANELRKTDPQAARAMKEDILNNKSDLYIFNWFKPLDGMYDEMAKQLPKAKSQEEYQRNMDTLIDYRTRMVEALGETDEQRSFEIRNSLFKTYQDYMMHYVERPKRYKAKKL